MMSDLLIWTTVELELDSFISKAILGDILSWTSVD